MYFVQHFCDLICSKLSPILKEKICGGEEHSRLEKMQREVSMNDKKLPETIKRLVNSGIVARVTAESTKEEGIGRFLVEIHQEEGCDYKAYEVIHFHEKHFK